MSELYGDEYDSVSAGGGRLIPSGLRRLAGAALFLGLIAALGIWAYRLGTRDAAEVPIIRAMEGPARVQPEDPGGLRAAHQGLEVNAVLAGAPAPVPETAAPLAPAPSPLADEDAPQGELVVGPPPITPEAELAAGEDLRMPLPDEGSPVAGPDAAADAATPEAAPPATTIATAPIVAAAIAEARAAADAAAGVDGAAPAVEPEAVAGAPGPRPLRRPSNLPPATARATAAEAAPAPPAAREVERVASGARLLQLGAFDSEAITRQAWNVLVSRHPDLLGAKSLYVERTTANARVFYRLRVAGFETADQTRQMCEALRARGVDCIPVTLN
jgi:hypothetical protein